MLIPVRNEAMTIGPLVLSLKSSALVMRVIVVANGTTDDTVLAAQRAGATVAYSNVIGKGQAVAAGLPYVLTARTFLCDGDLSPIPEGDIVRLAGLYGEETMVVGVPEFTANVPWAKEGALFDSLSGVRVLPTRFLFQLLEEGLLFGYTVEVMINNLIRNAGIPVRTFHMSGVKGRPRYNEERRESIMRDRQWLKARGIDYERLGWEST